MANKNKLYITISDERSGDGNTPTPQPDGTDKEETSVLGRYVEHQMFHLIKAQATQAANFALSNIGNFTGNYSVQRKVNELKQASSNIMNIGMSTLAGAQVGFVGAIVGFALGTISVVSSSVYQIIENDVENQKANYSIAQLRERAGLNTVFDNSRGTEN